VKRISTVYLDTPIFHSQRLEEGQSGQDWLTTSSDHYQYLWNVTPEPLHPQALSIDLTRAIPTHFPTTPSFLGNRLAPQDTLYISHLSLNDWLSHRYLSGLENPGANHICASQQKLELTSLSEILNLEVSL